MGKRLRCQRDEFERVAELPARMPITSAEAAVFTSYSLREFERMRAAATGPAGMQTSTDQLSTMREVGDGPPFIKLGDGAKAPVRYHLGKLRKWLEEHAFLNTAMAHVSRFATMGDFLSQGSIMDGFIAAVDVAGDLFDFWESVGCAWTTCWKLSATKLTDGMPKRGPSSWA
jgi:hypothetical protein